MKKGFTLIELLVVVLIIGVLAAIAAPKYMKVIERGKASEAMSLLKNITDSVQRYYTQHGEYTNVLTDLDITLPGSGTFAGAGIYITKNFSYSCSNHYCAARRINSATYQYFIEYQRTETLTKKWCQISLVPTSAENRQLCAIFGPEDPSSPGYFIIQ